MNAKHAMKSGQARAIKLTGEKLRFVFSKQCTNSEGKINKELLQGLTNQTRDGSYTLKSGKNWQFHLGNFDLIMEQWKPKYYDGGNKVVFKCATDTIFCDLRSRQFLKSFMLKGNFFAIYDYPNYLLFDSEDIISLMQDPDMLSWRILETGRIKGDMFFFEKRRTIFTLEYRAESHKNQFVFGAHGGDAGEKLKSILKHELFFNSVPVDFELWKEFL